MSNRIQVYENILEGLNDEQKEAVKRSLNWCNKIVAGAGTGKTEIISRRFTKLVFDLEEQKIIKPAGRVLVITFTDKAAINMKERIIKTLNKFNIDTFSSDLWISTFHSFCSRILNRHSLEVNLSPQCDLADEQTQKDIYSNIVQKLIYNEAKYIKNLDLVTSQINIDKNVLSAKKIQILNKIGNPENLFDDIYFIIKKIKSLGITPVEFYYKSLQSTSDFAEIVNKIPFNFCDKEGYMNAWELHLKPYLEDTARLDDDIFKGICGTKVILDKNGKRKAEEWGYATGYPENVNVISDIEVYLIKLVTLIYALYQNHLMEQDLIDYDDQINYTINILKNNESLRKYYQDLFKHIIIDEFQDTSGSQLELVKLLLNPVEPNITFVGDRKQSIYGFRYAQMENLEVLHKYIEDKHNKEYKEVKLKTNYRSTPYVLEPVNNLTREYLNLDEKLNSNTDKEYDRTNKNVQLTRILFKTNINEARIGEAKYIAQEIIKIKDQKPDLKYKDFAVLVPKHSRAELVELYLKGAGIPAVKKQDINYFKDSTVKNIIALMNLISNPRDEISFVRALEIMLGQRELYLTKKAIYELMPDTDDFIYNTNFVDKIIYLMENDQLQHLNIPDDIINYLETLIKTVMAISSDAQVLSLPQIFYKLKNKIPFYNNLPEIEVYNAEENIKILEKLLVDYTQSEDYEGIKGFVEALKTYPEDKNFELPSVTTKEIDAIQILTIHASKGLEFPYVFVTSLSNRKGRSSGSIIFDLQYGNKPGYGIISSKYNGKYTPKKVLYKELWEKPRELNENMRLFYVSISRAETYLNIINLIDPDKKKNVPEYTSDIICQDQVVEVELNDINYVKRPLEKPLYIEKVQQVKPEIVIKKALPEVNSLNLSFSRINTYKHCSRMYMLKYKYHFPKNRADSKAANIGSIIHTLIFNSLINNNLYPEVEIRNILAKQNLTDNDLQTILKLYQGYSKSGYTPDKLAGKEFMTESKFAFSEKYSNTEVLFAGDIDLIVRNKDGRYSVIDFKTNKNITDSLTAYYQQLVVYKKALEAEGKNVDDLIILNILDGDCKAYKPSIKEVENAQSELNNIVTEIVKLNVSSVMPDKNGKTNCKYCGYKYIC